jgi:hypothetical protein
MLIKFGNDATPDISPDVQELANLINDQSSEQRKLVIQFKSAMDRFASERSLESCLDALNVCMQLTNTRRHLLESYQRYSKLLEREITRISKDSKRGI